MPYFVVIRARGSAWDWSKPMRKQQNFDAHAKFMDALVVEGFIVAGGPLGDEDDATRVLHVVEARNSDAVKARLSEDPWKSDMLETVSVEPWTVLLGALKEER